MDTAYRSPLRRAPGIDERKSVRARFPLVPTLIGTLAAANVASVVLVLLN